MRYPTRLFVANSMADINPEKFLAQNPWVQAVSWDRDGTVTDYHSDVIPEAHLSLMCAFAELGIIQGFNSNSGTEDKSNHVHELAAKITGLIGSKFHASTSFEAGGRKPGPETFDRFALLSGVAKAFTIHVGDQMFKDVWGAQRAGLGGAMLVAKYGSGDDWRVKYGQRPVIELPMRLANGFTSRPAHFSRQVLYVSSPMPNVLDR